jgi:succinate dehydrogenase cytochrome b subunit
MEAERPTWPRRLHSISGVVPVGAFLFFHLSQNSAALRGADAYNEAAQRLQQFPLAVVLEIFVIGLPLFFHGVYGLFLAATERAGSAGGTAGHRALAVAQRVTGIVLFAFVLFHLWTARLVQIRDHGDLDLFQLMQSALASPWIRFFYIAGILSATFHLAAGLWTFSRTWGLARSPRASAALAVLATAVFVLLSAMGLRSLDAFRL